MARGSAGTAGSPVSPWIATQKTRFSLVLRLLGCPIPTFLVERQPKQCHCIEDRFLCPPARRFGDYICGGTFKTAAKAPTCRASHPGLVTVGGLKVLERI